MRYGRRRSDQARTSLKSTMSSLEIAPRTETLAGAVPVRPIRQRRVPGEVGTWVFIFGDMAVFALLFGVFIYYRGRQPSLFDHAQLTLHKSFGLINTVLLLTSSLCVITAVRAVRAGMRQLAQPLFVSALACGLGFTLDKFLEWSGLISHGFKPATNHFYMYFFVLTGIHFFHLLIGMGVLVALFALTRKEQLSPTQLALVEGGACFWHMVDLVWIVLFALLYLVH
jgi:nitric oxide reductase NorE protein